MNMYVHKVVELAGGFVVTPHQAHYPNKPVSLECALVHWYNSHFEGSDPLGMTGTLLEYITEE